ncbi:MAG: sulfatase-like hydrolase/transferase, partial [Candidatus Omnitrophica bacterium]|nr:sulfatase-like hydrolase/transferase [Candidatus Omnitrophota bacterium]
MKAWSEAAPAVVTRGKTGPEWFNVLVVKSDEHNPFFSSLSRHSFVETPNMRRLAERGVVFENTYCPSPLCSPCRSSFASGLRVHRIQRYNNCTIPFANHPCYGRILAENGVHSVHAGKADFYNKTATLGFNEMLSPGDRGGCDGSISRNPLAIREDGASRASGFGVREENLDHDTKRTDEALAWLRETGAKLDRPWTLDLNLVKPHFPHFVSQELWDHYADHEDLPQYGREVETAQHPFAQDLRAHFQTDQFTESQTRGLRRGYYGCVAFIDRQLGRVLDVLEETGLSERTIVAYTSDHGEMLGKFGMWWKCSLYEDSARVPLIVAGPGFGRGKTVHTPVDLLDLQATLFRATGRDSARPPEWVGRPLQDIPDHDPSRVVFSEYHGHGTRASG